MARPWRILLAVLMPPVSGENPAEPDNDKTVVQPIVLLAPSHPGGNKFESKAAYLLTLVGGFACLFLVTVLAVFLSRNNPAQANTKVQKAKAEKVEKWEAKK